MNPDEENSLIRAAEAAQLSTPFLFPAEIEDEVRKAEREGEFTGERLFRQDPEKYGFIVSMLAEGTIPDAYIAKVTKVSRNTIAAVREREKIPIEQEKGRILKNIRTALHMTTEKLIEQLPNMSGKELIFALGILADRHQLLSGEATQIIATATDKAKHASFNDMLEALPVADATVVGMGSGGGSLEHKGPPALGAGAAERMADGRTLEGEVIPIPEADSKSGVSRGETASSNEQRNTLPMQGSEDAPQGSDDRTPGPRPEEGGRGVAEGEGGEKPN